jgi:hypothetical protein
VVRNYAVEDHLRPPCPDTMVHWERSQRRSILCSGDYLTRNKPDLRYWRDIFVVAPHGLGYILADVGELFRFSEKGEFQESITPTRTFNSC